MRVPASGAVLLAEDKEAMHAVVEAGWLTAGVVNGEFEAALVKYTGIRNVRTCNSGSSANLLAVGAMVESGRWKKGDRILTVAAAFPTTVNPLLLYGLVPVFVDVELGTYNVHMGELDRAAAEYNPVGVMMAHTLGNPYDVWTVAKIARQHDLGIVADCCDALGAEVDGHSVFQYADIATCSFFPAHHITTGEGGAVFTNDDSLAGLVTSLRDWGRDCWCAPGANDTCGRRYEWKSSEVGGSLPDGYDHKGICRTLGFNLKGTEVGAACGLSQLGRITGIVASRRRNFAYLFERLERLCDYVVLPFFRAGSSPFGFPITIKEPGQRRDLQRYLTQEGVDSRTLFSGNLTRHPYMAGREWMVSGSLENTDKIMHDTIWIGCHPELSEEQLAYSAAKIGEFFGVFE